MDDPNRGRGGRYYEDGTGNRLPVESNEEPVENVKTPDPLTVPLPATEADAKQPDGVNDNGQ